MDDVVCVAGEATVQKLQRGVEPSRDSEIGAVSFTFFFK